MPKISLINFIGNRAVSQSLCEAKSSSTKSFLHPAASYTPRHSCNKDLRRFWRFLDKIDSYQVTQNLDSPLPQGDCPLAKDS